MRCSPGSSRFQGDNLLALSKAIQESQPAALTGRSLSLSSVVSRALHQSQSQRYQAVPDLLDELRNATAPTT